MGRFVDKGNTKAIRAPWWDEGEEVVIKRFSYGDRQKLNERADLAKPLATSCAHQYRLVLIRTRG